MHKLIIALTLTLGLSIGCALHTNDAPTASPKPAACVELPVSVIVEGSAYGSHVWSSEDGDGPVFAYSNEEDGRLWNTLACAESHPTY